MSKKSFDLVASLQNLFTRAEAEQDYAGAASVARVIRDLTPEAPAEAQEEHGHYVDAISFDAFTADEIQRIDAIANAKLDLYVEVSARTGVPCSPSLLEELARRDRNRAIDVDAKLLKERQAHAQRVNAALLGAPSPAPARQVSTPAPSSALVEIPESLYPRLGGERVGGTWTSALGDEHWAKTLDDLRHGRTTVEAVTNDHAATMRRRNSFASAIARSRDDE